MGDSTTGQIVGGVAGAILGGIITGNPYGAYVGFTLGYGVGGMVDPPPGLEEEGDIDSSGISDIQDLALAPADETIPIADAVGLVKVTGNIIWQGNEYAELVAGTWRYYMSWAVGICHGPVDEVLGIYKNDELYYYGRSARTSNGHVELYLGSDSVPTANTGTSSDQVVFTIDAGFFRWWMDDNDDPSSTRVYIYYRVLSSFTLVTPEVGRTITSIKIKGTCPGAVERNVTSFLYDSKHVGGVDPEIDTEWSFPNVVCDLDGPLGCAYTAEHHLLLVTVEYDDVETIQDEREFHMGYCDFYFVLITKNLMQV